MIIDLFPLNSVVFPYQRLALRIFEPRYLKLIERCYREAHSFGICLIREGKEVGAPAIPFTIGTSVVIKEFLKVSDNLFSIVVQGEKRFRIRHIVHEQPHIKADIEWLDDKAPCFPGDYTALRKTINDIVKDKGKILVNDNELLGLLGELIAVYTGEKQKILELPNEQFIPALTSFLQSI